MSVLTGMNVRGYLLVLLAGVMLQAAAPRSVDEVVSRLDANARGFTGVSADIKRLNYTAIVKETEIEEGSLTLKKASNGSVTAKLDLRVPNAKTFLFSGRKLEIYYPKAKMVEEFDLGKARRLVDQFLLLGFGTSGKDLRAAYDIQLSGQEKVGQTDTWKLTLVPKSKEAKAQLPKVELWYPEEGADPVQQKLYMPSGDYTLVTYSNVQRKSIPDSALALSLPAGVTRRQPQSGAND